MHKVYFLLFCSLFFPAKGFAQSETRQQSLFQYLASIEDSIPLLKLDTDIRQLIKHKQAEEYQDAIFSFQDAGGATQNLVAKIRARGNMRKQVCYFPPIKVNLKKSDLEKLGYDSLDQLKLVLQCWDNKRGYSLLHRELLLYQLQEEVGPFSYQTSLIRIQLGTKFDQPHHAFLIEEEKEFAQRLNGLVLEKGILKDQMIDRESYLRMCFFQYLILNTDWYMHNRHNLEFVRPAGYQQFCPVPYDFDYAGLADASYAVPHSSRNIKSVKQPLYLCKDVSQEEARNMARFFREKKPRLYQIVRQYPYLEDKEKAAFLDRLDTFYEEISDEKLLNRFFTNKKRK